MDVPPPRFGTDGLRGKAGDPPLDTDTLRRVGAALGAWLQRDGSAPRNVAIGNDGRASAGWIRDALTAGLASANAQASDLGLVTTPALAFATQAASLDAGIMISASHNPAADNGVKIFAGDGFKLPDEAERAIEDLCTTVSPTEDEAACVSRPDLVSHYEDFLIERFAGLDLSGRSIVIDAANGGGATLAPKMLARFGADVIQVACAPDGNNINLDCGALHPQKAAETVVANGALLGICLDGDGDRVIIADDTGVIRDGDEVMAVLGRSLKAQSQLAGDTVVATVMSNLGLHKLLRGDGISVHTTPVGDRAVVQAMRTHGYSLGGEQSGHIIFREERHCTGDGLFTALVLLSMTQASSTAPLFADFVRFPQLLINVEVGHKPDLDTLPDVQEAVRTVEDALGSDGRVLLRYSGTENLCRVMVEGPDDATVREHAEHIAAAVRRALC